MRARIKALALFAVTALWPLTGQAQDDVSWGGTLKKRQLQLTQMLQGRFSNKEQAAFAIALTRDGEKPFETVYELTISASEGGGLTARASSAELFADLSIMVSVKNERLHVHGEGKSSVCHGDAEAFLDGFDIAFTAKKNRNCPFGDRLTVLPEGLQLAATKDRPALPLMRAHDFSCWVTMPRKNGEGWFFKAGVPLHDQGGEVWVDTDETPPQRVGLKMRQAVWPYGRSRPSLVLYVHKSEDPDRAASYTWANPDADRIGLNLRWMQASCTKQ